MLNGAIAEPPDKRHAGLTVIYRGVLLEPEGATMTNSIPDFIRRIGTCPKCMRESFLAAAAAWAAWLGAGLAGLSFGSNLPVIAASIVAVPLTLLWLLHLTVFAARAARREVHRKEAIAEGPAPMTTRPPLPRRAFVLRFAMILAGATLAVAVSGRQALADFWYACGGTFCQGTACCPNTARYLNHCDCRCYESSDFDCGSYTYCSLDGSNCS